MTDRTPRLGGHLHALVAELVASDGLLLALDFDGTLAPIVDEPDEATVPDDARAAIDALDSHDRVTVSVVSGRALSDLRDRVMAAAYAGNHGLEFATGEETRVADEAVASRDALDRATDSLDAALADVDGAFVEEKGVTATVHYRRADEADVPDIERTVRGVAGRHDALRVTEGKQILELRPAVDWDKGDAVAWLTETHVPADERWCRVYVGDDRTDEDAFAALGEAGLGIAVGDSGLCSAASAGPTAASAEPTAADYRVRDPDAVAALLWWLVDFGVTFLDRDPQAVSLPA